MDTHVEPHLANHSFDVLVISRSLGWMRSSQSNIAAGISEEHLGNQWEATNSSRGTTAYRVVGGWA